MGSRDEYRLYDFGHQLSVPGVIPARNRFEVEVMVRVHGGGPFSGNAREGYNSPSITADFLFYPQRKIMYKYLAPILALGLCACGGAYNATALPAQTAPVVTPAHTEAVVAPAQDESPVDLELSRGRHAQAVRCSDNLDCLQKMSGRCSNGYSGGEFLTDGTKVVGLLFHCVTDEEKVAAEKQAAQEAAQEAEWQAARQAQIKAAQEAAQKKPAKK
jgi:hypothetical protein